MSRRKTKAENIQNPEHYFNRYIAKEVIHDTEETQAYKKHNNSFEAILCLQWYPCSASAFRQREQLGDILGGVRFPECVAKRSLAERPRLGKLCQIQASH